MPSVQQSVRSRRVGHGLATEQQGYSNVHQNLGTIETFLRGGSCTSNIPLPQLTNENSYCKILEYFEINGHTWNPRAVSDLSEGRQPGFHQKAVACSVKTVISQHGEFNLEEQNQKAERFSVTGLAENVVS